MSPCSQLHHHQMMTVASCTNDGGLFLAYFYMCVLVIRPLVYSVSVLLPVAYIIGLIFTLKTHSHIYNIHVGEGQSKNHSHD